MTNDSDLKPNANALTSEQKEILNTIFTFDTEISYCKEKLKEIDLEIEKQKERLRKLSIEIKKGEA